MQTRRTFVATAAVALLTPRLLRAQTTRPNIAQIDRIRILAAASVALTRTPAGSTLDTLALDLPALAAASVIDQPDAARYSLAATRLFPALTALPTNANEAEIVARAALAEVAVALPFLAPEPAVLKPITSWFEQYLTFLTTDRAALLTSEKNDHRGLAWLLQAAASARLLASSSNAADTILAGLRHRYKTPILRAHVDARGFFAHDITTPNPFRNSLFSLDLLAGTCQLLSTRFESIWDFDLPEGAGMRAAIARHAPYIASPATWPYPAEPLFHALPARRPALVFAARAYQQADYATLWQTLSPDQPTDPEILRTFPIRQPLLWLAQPRPV